MSGRSECNHRQVKALQAKGLLQSHLIELETACIIAVFNFFQGLVAGRSIYDGRFSGSVRP